MKKKMIVAVVFLLFVGWILWGNTALMVTELTIKNEEIPFGFSGFRIAQISDLHNAEFGKENEKLLSMLEDCEPDMILITGDLIDSRRTDIETGISFAKKTVLIAPTYYVTGNHEARIEEYEELIAGLENAGVHLLDNESVMVENSGDRITVTGMKDPSFVTDYLFGDSKTVAEDALTKLISNKDIYTVLLSHRPELFETYVECGADLVFSGHAHGGQFRIPFVGGLVAPNQGLFPKYAGGRYNYETGTMIVSRGLARESTPIPRIFNRPELVIVDIT